jgi:hypothetical protein
VSLFIVEIRPSRTVTLRQSNTSESEVHDPGPHATRVPFMGHKSVHILLAKDNCRRHSGAHTVFNEQLTRKEQALIKHAGHGC